MASEHLVPTRTPSNDSSVLGDPGWLASHLDDPNLRVVEVDVSSAAYDDWHIDGAVLWNIYRDLKDAEYRLLELPALERLISDSGITAQTTVVFYGYAPAVGFWLMKLCGHRDVRMLNCSRDAWRAGGHPWSSVAAAPTPTAYQLGEIDERLRADRAAVRAAIDDADTRLVDVRSKPEYDGERFWPSGGSEPGGRAGHIPNAIHQPIDGLYEEDGSFRATSELSSIVSAIDVDSDYELITYCTIGGRAATAWFVLTQLLGRQNVRVYDGSWAEWGRSPDVPVATS